MLPLVFSHGAHTYRLVHDPFAPAPPAKTYERVRNAEAGRILVAVFLRDFVAGPRIRQLWAEVELTMVAPHRSQDGEVVAWLRRTRYRIRLVSRSPIVMVHSGKNRKLIQPFSTRRFRTQSVISRLPTAISSCTATRERYPASHIISKVCSK